MAFEAGKIIDFFKDARKELKKVVWPSKRDIINHTIIVIAISLILAGIFGVLDLVFSFGIKELIS